MASVRSIMQSDLVVVTDHESVATAIERMDSKGVGALIVLCSGRVCGILSERDVVRRLVLQGRDPHGTRVGDIATPSPTVVGDDAPVEECAVLLRDSGFRHLPIVDAEGRPLGIISSRDLLDFAIEALRS